jgi:methylenetetrahydrofolate reductase (NADPH)
VLSLTSRISTRFVSVELWPPRTPEAAEKLERTLFELLELRPAFVTITYGAGGSTRERTHELVVRFVNTPFTPVAHLTCAAHTRAELITILRRYRDAGVDNVLALRGDPPLSSPTELPEGELRYALELVRLAREEGISCVGVALHPEGHPSSRSVAEDLRRQAAKLKEADFGLTQFVNRLEDYLRLVEELELRGTSAPIIPGVMPITNLRQAKRMAEMSGCQIPPALMKQLTAAGDDPEKIQRIGIEHASQVCHELLEAGAPGLHFYTMNRAAPTREVCRNIGWEPIPSQWSPPEVLRGPVRIVE